MFIAVRRGDERLSQPTAGSRRGSADRNGRGCRVRQRLGPSVLGNLRPGSQTTDQVSVHSVAVSTRHVPPPWSVDGPRKGRSKTPEDEPVVRPRDRGTPRNMAASSGVPTETTTHRRWIPAPRSSKRRSVPGRDAAPSNRAAETAPAPRGHVHGWPGFTGREPCRTTRTRLRSAALEECLGPSPDHHVGHPCFRRPCEAAFRSGLSTLSSGPPPVSTGASASQQESS
jgi:hypothetical protein